MHIVPREDIDIYFTSTVCVLLISWCTHADTFVSLVSALQFVGIHVQSFYCVGTPTQLRSFLNFIRAGVFTPRHKARVCFDLDRSLLDVYSEADDAQAVAVRPVKRNVRLLKVCGRIHMFFFTYCPEAGQTQTRQQLIGPRVSLQVPCSSCRSHRYMGPPAQYGCRFDVLAVPPSPRGIIRRLRGALL